MKLIVVRHGPAGSREEFAETGMSDGLRPLTEKGRRKMLRAAAGLHRLVDDIDLFVSSSLLRARETADIVAREYDATAVVERQELSPDAPPSALVEWLAAHATEDTVAVFGHEPHMTAFVSLLLTGRADAILAMKKGGAALIDLEEPAAGAGTLLWALTPRQLRLLRRRS